MAPPWKKGEGFGPGTHTYTRAVPCGICLSFKVQGLELPRGTCLRIALQSLRTALERTSAHFHPLATLTRSCLGHHGIMSTVLALGLHMSGREGQFMRWCKAFTLADKKWFVPSHKCVCLSGKPRLKQSREAELDPPTHTPREGECAGWHNPPPRCPWEWS